jgi:integrase
MARYLFQRPDSKYWQLKLQSPDGRTEVSLRTTDRAQAEIMAMPLIQAHKQKLLARKPTVAPVWLHELEPNREHPGPDGSRIIATDRELIYLDAAGAVTRTAPNGKQVFQITGAPLNLEQPAVAARWHRTVQELINTLPTVATRGDDDKIIETYLAHVKLVDRQEREARAMWALFRELCPGVKLKDATRDDGRKLVAHLQERGNKSATIEKKISWLNAAVNFSIKEGTLKFNPFASVVPNAKDALLRLPFKDDDMKLIRDNLHKLPPADQLMVRILATTGMRLGELFQIKGEETERGIRYVKTGSKTEQSLRRVPLPAKLLPHLPTIKGPLFPLGGKSIERASKTASARLMRWLREECRIEDDAKVLHSFRHRAQDRLRAAGCREDIRWGVLGHEKKTIAEGYGEGFPVTVLKKWIDKIGF